MPDKKIDDRVSLHARLTEVCTTQTMLEYHLPYLWRRVDEEKEKEKQKIGNR